MQLKQIADSLSIARPSPTDGSPRWIGRSTLSAHFSASLRRRTVSLTYFPFRRIWTRQDPDLSFVKVAKTCVLRVHGAVELRRNRLNDGAETSAYDPT